MKADILKREFAPRRVSDEPGPLILTPDDALGLVDRAAEEGVPVMAVDGFVGDREMRRPERHVDFSAAVAQGHGCWADADAFIRAQRGRGLLFALELGDDPIEAV